MKRGRKPPIVNAFVWTFAAGSLWSLGFMHRSPAEVACAVGFAVIGPIAWFVGRP